MTCTVWHTVLASEASVYLLTRNKKSSIWQMIGISHLQQVLPIAHLLLILHRRQRSKQQLFEQAGATSAPQPAAQLQGCMPHHQTSSTCPLCCRCSRSDSLKQINPPSPPFPHPTPNAIYHTCNKDSVSANEKVPKSHVASLGSQLACVHDDVCT